MKRDLANIQNLVVALMKQFLMPFSCNLEHSEFLDLLIPQDFIEGESVEFKQFIEQLASIDSLTLLSSFSECMKL